MLSHEIQQHLAADQESDMLNTSSAMVRDDCEAKLSCMAMADVQGWPLPSGFSPSESM